MPPVRKASKSADEIAAANKIKPMKTVRTHEENQERAYVAASRRSDRSLEARIESARRASEIHKKRTGRAFRITEEDVLNEQYYEEVDDDIPASIRRLQMHLNGLYHWNNPRFDSYMISNYAKHHAAWIAQRYSQQGNSQYANPPIFSNSFGQGQGQGQGTAGAPMTSPSMGNMSSPGFPPNMAGQANSPHQRSVSIASPGSGYQSSDQTFMPTGNFTTDEQRRFSLPAHPPMRKNVRQGQLKTERAERNSSAASVASDTSGQTARLSPASDQSMSTSPMLNTTAQPQMTGQNFDNFSPNSFGPFSPTLPLNLSQIWDPSSQMQNASFYDANMGFQYNSNPNLSKSQEQNVAFNQGIHQTLTSNPLGISGMAAESSKHNAKVGSPPAGGNSHFDGFWNADNSQGNIGTDFEGFFNFPSGEDQEGMGFLNDYVNVNDDAQVTE